jgi:hypothetical protein
MPMTGSEVASDIVVTGAKLFHSPKGTTLPAASIAADGDWGTGWSYLGYTLEPTKVTYKFDVLEIMVQQTLNSVRRTRIKEELTFSSVLAQHSTDAMALAMAGTSTATAAATGVPGYEEFKVGGEPVLPERQWGIEGRYEDEDGAIFPIRVFVWRATSAEGGDLEYDREKPAGIPLTIKALADTSKSRGNHLMTIQRVLEPGL